MNGSDVEHLEELSNTELQEFLLSLGPEMNWVVGDHNRHTTIAMLRFYFTMQRGPQTDGNANSAASSQLSGGEASTGIGGKKRKGQR